MGDPEESEVDPVALVAQKKAEVAAKQKARREAEIAKAREQEKKRSEALKSIVVIPFAKSAEEKPKGAGATEPPIFDPDDLTKVPGIVGRLIDWMTAASLYPNRR